MTLSFPKTLFALSLSALLIGCSCSKLEGGEGEEGGSPSLQTLAADPASIETVPAAGGDYAFVIKADDVWRATASASWLRADPSQGFKGETSLTLKVDPNPSEAPREALLTLSMGDSSVEIPVSQEGEKIPSFVPEGYTLVFSEEFDAPLQSGGRTPLPDASKWSFETGGGGWGNNELQEYVPGFLGSDTTTVIRDGVLTIRVLEREGKVLSARMNTKEEWLYGYFEARLLLPSGKGTWPAFWMMPRDFKSWPLDGEIDIMEHVGYDPGVVHFSIHTESYNHVDGTQKTATKAVPDFDKAYHIYALEWTPELIRGFIDGEEYFTFANDKRGDKNTWPFDKPFYLKLNLAWGGNWGGQKGIDPSALPAEYKADYVRVYQKK